jgi:hypothetical protein
VLDGNVQNKKQGKRGRLYTSYDAEHLNQHLHFIYSYERGNGKDCSVCSKRGIRLYKRSCVVLQYLDKKNWNLPW